MSDLISRSALLEEIKRYQMNIVSKATVVKVINWQPSVEVTPVGHGEWIAQDKGLTRFMCSVCKGENHSGHEKFCPECGADMRKNV